MRWLEDYAEHLKSEEGSEIFGEDVFVQFYSESTVPTKMVDFRNKYSNGRFAALLQGGVYACVRTKYVARRKN